MQTDDLPSPTIFDFRDPGRSGQFRNASKVIHFIKPNDQMKLVNAMRFHYTNDHYEVLAGLPCSQTPSWKGTAESNK